MKQMKLQEFYKNKRVLITGHTGFKGAWMCMVLKSLGANVYGYAMEPPTSPSLYELCGLRDEVKSSTADIRDLNRLRMDFNSFRPEIVIHMAAQPIVRESYRDPVYTYEVNVMGTVHLTECVRNCPSVRSVVNVTTDKVYLNREWERGYTEEDELNGFDPYSNSKSCSELVTSCYKNSFLGGNTGKTEEGREVRISTCRAGNVIGGGDFAADRIIPDCLRAIETGKELVVRNPSSIRPYQHVLEPVVVYLELAMEQWDNAALAGSYNIGPKDQDCWTTAELVTAYYEEWEKLTGQHIHWEERHDGGPHEANLLKLDCRKLCENLCWKPVWNVRTALRKIAEWNCDYLAGENMRAVTQRQIDEYLSL